MTIKKAFLPVVSLILILSAVLTACRATPITVEDDLQAAVAQTLTAMPTSTPIPTVTSTLTPTVTPTAAPVHYGPTGFPADIDPLTGLTVSDPSILNRRPVMVKVANYPVEGRPHFGLSKADIVFDYSTGLGENRFLALYYGQNANKIGPVRSGRWIDSYLVRMYQGIFGLEYAWPPIYEAILQQIGSSRTISGGPNTCPALCSEGDRTIISNFANSAEMSKYYSDVKIKTADSRQNLDGMVFDTNPPAGGVDGHQALMQDGKYNFAQWKYDAASGKYLRWIDHKIAVDEVEMIPLVDGATNEQLAFSNIIILFSKLTVLNSADTEHDYEIAGTKDRALLFRDGKMYDGYYKSSYDAPIQFYDSAGNLFALKPGNTWIHITGLSSLVAEDEPGLWHVTLRYDVLKKELK